MSIESDEEIIARKERERAVREAWKNFRATSSRRVRRVLHHLPEANPTPKAIIVTKNRTVDKSTNGWKSWDKTNRPS